MLNKYFNNKQRLQGITLIVIFVVSFMLSGLTVTAQELSAIKSLSDDISRNSGDVFLKGARDQDLLLIKKGIS